MRQHLLIVLVGMLTLSVVSCGGGDESTQQSPTPSSSATPSGSPSASASPQSSANQPFSSPPLVAQQPENAPAVPGLVQSTNPNSRVEEVQKGRKDPFAIIPVQPIVKVSPTAEGQGTGSGSTTSEAPKPVPAIPVIPVVPPLNFGGPSLSRPKLPSRIARLPSRPPNPQPKPTRIATPSLPGPLPSFRPELPRLPEPTLAQSVEVTGVVQVDGQPEAIVKAPNEPSSRYVMVGQRLANGQVLVKRIEMNEGSTPIVILEQYGIEVAKAVGEKLVPNQQNGRPTAAIPLGRQWKTLSSSVT